MATLWEEQIESADVSETHWSASTVMAIFMAASLVSAVFFGLGYSFGRGGTAKPVLRAAASGPAYAPGSLPQRSFVQAAGNPALRNIAAVSAPSLSTVNHTAPQDATPMAALRPALVGPIRRAPTVSARQHQIAREVEHPTRKAAAPRDSSSAHYMVQVGAVGDRRDARTLVSQLRKRGFHAGIYSAKHDRFLHVQIGPFANVQQAQIVRHHVMASGYRAILKHAS